LDVALPSRRDEARFGPVGSAEGDARYAETVREQSAAFASGQRSQGTAREHEEYTLMFEDWLVGIPSFGVWVKGGVVTRGGATPPCGGCPQ
jgi:hypothetical protein